MINLNLSTKELYELIEKLKTVPDMPKEEAEAFKTQLEQDPQYQIIRDMHDVLKKHEVPISKKSPK